MKLLFFVIVILAIYIVVRRMSSSYAVSADNYRPPEPSTVIDAQDVEESRYRNQYEVTRYYFEKTDPAQGPPDPDEFYDQFFVDLTNVETGDRFSNSMYVCTPQGLKQEMIKQKWGSVVGTELLIVPRYNLDAILAGAKRHLEEIYESTLKIAPRARSREHMA